VENALATLRQEWREKTVGKFDQRRFLAPHFKATDFDLIVYVAHEDGKNLLDDATHVWHDGYRRIKIYLAASPAQSKRESRRDDVTEDEKDEPWPPTLTVFGELDGIRRLFRYASDAFQMRHQPHMYYAVVPEANHHLVTISSPWSVWDIPSKANRDDVQNNVVGAVADFIRVHATPESDATLKERIQKRQDLALAHFSPIWKSLLLESSYELLPPCHIYNDKDPASVKRPCFVGSPWAEMIQRRVVLGRLPLASEQLDKDANVMDELHFSWVVRPFHHPSIENTCRQGDHCTIQMRTVTQNEYTPSKNSGNPFTPATSLHPVASSYIEVPVSASALLAKQKARHAFERAAGNRSASFDELDGGTRRCAEQNELAWQFVLRLLGLPPTANIEPGVWEHIDVTVAVLEKNWLTSGMVNVPKNVLEQVKQRWQQHSQPVPPMVMADDTKSMFNVFNWLFADLQWTLDSNVRRLLVKAPMARFSDRFPLEYSRGMRYCKLLSPARALEWIMTDGLRAYNTHV
jgi:hypothetical protein